MSPFFVMRNIISKKILLVIMALIVVTSTLIQGSFASGIYYPSNGNHSIDSTPGNSDIIVTGDSYAQHFLKDIGSKRREFVEYSQEGYTVFKNKNNLMKAFTSLGNIIFLSIGVNDHLNLTPPSDFENTIREFIDKGTETGKTVFLHTYMRYPASIYVQNPFTVDMYDSILRKLAEEYDNVYYIDTSDMNLQDFFLDDGIHCNKKFNEELYKRLMYYIYLVRNKQI